MNAPSSARRCALLVAVSALLAISSPASAITISVLLNAGAGNYDVGTATDTLTVGVGDAFTMLFMLDNESADPVLGVFTSVSFDSSVIDAVAGSGVAYPTLFDPVVGVGLFPLGGPRPVREPSGGLPAPGQYRTIQSGAGATPNPTTVSNGPELAAALTFSALAPGTSTANGFFAPGDIIAYRIDGVVSKCPNCPPSAAFPTGGSPVMFEDAAVTVAGPAVPEPRSALLFAAGSVVVGLGLRHPSFRSRVRA